MFTDEEEGGTCVSVVSGNYEFHRIVVLEQGEGAGFEQKCSYIPMRIDAELTLLARERGPKRTAGGKKEEETQGQE